MRNRATADHFIEIGVIQGVHGLKGALRVHSNTRPDDAIAGYSFWWLGHSAENLCRHAVKRCWRQGRRILAMLEGIDDIDQAERCKNMRIWVPYDAIEVGEDEYLWVDLIGCLVYRADNNALLGRVTHLADYGAQDILVIEACEGVERPGEWMLPFTKEVVREVDIAARRIIVTLPEGMDACFTSRC